MTANCIFAYSLCLSPVGAFQVLEGKSTVDCGLSTIFAAQTHSPYE
jgi:hypothetical protein